MCFKVSSKKSCQWYHDVDEDNVVIITGGICGWIRWSNGTLELYIAGCGTLIIEWVTLFFF